MNRIDIFYYLLRGAENVLNFALFGVSKKQINRWAAAIDDARSLEEIDALLCSIWAKLPRTHPFVLRVEHRAVVLKRKFSHEEHPKPSNGDQH